MQLHCINFESLYKLRGKALGAAGVNLGFEIGGGGGGARNAFEKNFFSATLAFKSTTRFGYLGIVTLSSQLSGINKPA